MDDVVIARALHVLAVIHWIGGLAFVTLIILPLGRMCRTGDEGLALFERVERRFAAQVRVSVPLAGVCGLWMTYRLDLWDRFADPQFWWMTAMLALWLVFMLMLFVIEPIVHARFGQSLQPEASKTLRRLSRMHEFMLLLAAITAFGAVAGAHGMVLF
jgi:uncharacterized membrane protein